MQGLFKKLKSKVIQGRSGQDNETMTIMSDNSPKSILTTTTNMASPFKSSNQFNKLSSKTLKDLYEKLPDFKQDQIRDVGYLLSKILAEYFASMILGLSDVPKIQELDDEEMYFEMRQICLDTDKKFKALYSRLDEMNNAQKQEVSKDNFLDDLDTTASDQGEEKNAFLQQLSRDPNINFELNITPVANNLEGETEPSVQKNEEPEEPEKMETIFSCPLSQKFEHFRMRDLRSRKAVVKSMLWALGNQQEDSFNGRHRNDVSFKVSIFIFLKCLIFRQKMVQSFQPNMEFFEKYMAMRCREVRKDIGNCWRMLRGITKDEEILQGGLSDQNIQESVKKLLAKIKQLNNQFKYYNECKTYPNFVKVESEKGDKQAKLPLRLGFSENKKYIYVAGMGCKLIKRNLRDFNDKIFSKGSK